jgi:ATP-dependent DNA helicase RecQ
VLNVLEGVGALRLDLDGRVHPVEESRSPEELAQAGAGRVARRRALERSRVEMMRTYAETNGCRRRVILELLGEDVTEPCRRCDSCDLGRSEVTEDRPYALGSRVSHAEFGEGSIRILRGRAGRRALRRRRLQDLSAPVVAERELLVPLARASA